MKIYTLYENEEWLTPLLRELDRAGLPHEELFVDRGVLDLQATPPEGVFLNRISPSSHTRGHHDSIAFVRETLAWLESYGRRVVNGTPAFALEVSKVRQYAALAQAGIRTPRTLAVSGGAEELTAAGRQMSLPFITKHNCGGKGLGVQLFKGRKAFEDYVHSSEFIPSPDRITLLQEYIEPVKGFITRVELVGDQFLYAINSDTSQGFQLCPSDRCATEDAFCPTTDTPPKDIKADRQSLFSLRQDFDDPIIGNYLEFIAENDIDIAGIEFIEDKNGNKVTYDINTTTNYSHAVEERHHLNGMEAMARLLAQIFEEKAALQRQVAVA